MEAWNLLLGWGRAFLRDYLSLMMAPTTSSIASVTRLVGRLKLLVRIEKQTSSPDSVVA